MKHSDMNHLRRLLGWVAGEIGQTPNEMVATFKTLADKGAFADGDIDDAGKQRIVEAHDKARAVPKYVRDALKALTKATAGHEADWTENEDAPPADRLPAPELVKRTQ